jgi:signal transduction histidine kinase
MSDLLRETSLNESQQEIVGQRYANASQLALAQIEDVLDAAKIEAGARSDWKTRPFDLSRLLNSTREGNRSTGAI